MTSFLHRDPCHRAQLRVDASDSSPDVARTSRPWVWSGMGVPPMFWRRFRLRQAYGGQVAPSMGGTRMPLPPPSTRRCAPCHPPSAPGLNRKSKVPDLRLPHTDRSSSNPSPVSRLVPPVTCTVLISSPRQCQSRPANRSLSSLSFSFVRGWRRARERLRERGKRKITRNGSDFDTVLISSS